MSHERRARPGHTRQGVLGVSGRGQPRLRSFLASLVAVSVRGVFGRVCGAGVPAVIHSS